MAVLAVKNLDVKEAAERAARDLVSVRHWGDSSFVSLPLIYPDGSSVTVKLDLIRGGFRVSDNGFAYRQVENIGFQSSFAKAAERAAEVNEVGVGKRIISIDATPDELSRAICDVAISSWTVADKICRAAEAVDTDLQSELRTKLERVFGLKLRKPTETIAGASTTDWKVSGIIDFGQRRAVFHAVPNHPIAVYHTGTAFRDLASLDNPPSLIAVVRNKLEMGAKLTLLSQAEARIIEDKDADEIFQRAAA